MQHNGIRPAFRSRVIRDNVSLNNGKEHLSRRFASHPRSIELLSHLHCVLMNLKRRHVIGALRGFWDQLQSNQLPLPQGGWSPEAGEQKHLFRQIKKCVSDINQMQFISIQVTKPNFSEFHMTATFLTLAYSKTIYCLINAHF